MRTQCHKSVSIAPVRIERVSFVSFPKESRVLSRLFLCQSGFSYRPNRAMKSASERIGIPSSLAFVFLEEVEVTSLFTR